MVIGNLLSVKAWLEERIWLEPSCTLLDPCTLSLCMFHKRRLIQTSNTEKAVTVGPEDSSANINTTYGSYQTRPLLPSTGDTLRQNKIKSSLDVLGP